MDPQQPQTPVPMRLEHQISWKGRYAETNTVKGEKNTKIPSWFELWIIQGLDLSNAIKSILEYLNLKS